MKKDQVRIGCTYSAKASGSVAPVRITQKKWKGDRHAGWAGTNTQTGRSVYIKSAQRLRGLLCSAEGSSGPAAKTVKVAPPVGHVAGDVGHRGASAAVVGTSAIAASPVPPKAGGASAGKEKTATSGKKATPGHKASKGGKAPKTKKPKSNRPMSALDAAARVLSDAGEPMKVKDIVIVAEKKGVWKSKAGKTPEATVYAAMIREILQKGAGSRFVKKGRGLFAAAQKGT